MSWCAYALYMYCTSYYNGSRVRHIAHIWCSRVDTLFVNTYQFTFSTTFIFYFTFSCMREKYVKLRINTNHLILMHMIEVKCRRTRHIKFRCSFSRRLCAEEAAAAAGTDNPHIFSYPASSFSSDQWSGEAMQCALCLSLTKSLQKQKCLFSKSDHLILLRPLTSK